MAAKMPVFRRTFRCLTVAFLVAACGGTDGTADDVPATGDATAEAPAAAPSPASAGSGSSVISGQDLDRYRMDMSTMQQWHRVQLASARQPDLRLDDEDEEDMGGMDASAATRFLQRIEARADIADAIRAAGMQPREFVLATFAMAQGAVGYAVAEQGQPLPEGISQHHVDFFRTHEAEFRRMQEEQAAARRGSDG